MRIPLPLKASIVLLAALSLFWFPWTVSVGLLFCAGLAYPPAALALGVVADILYYPGHGFLAGSFTGLVLALLAALVRHFVKTRIM